MSSVDRIGVSLIIAVANIYMYLGATARVSGDRAGFIDMDGFILVRRVRISAIRDVLTDRALQLQTASGRLIRTAAYLPAPAGEMLGYPNSRRAAERIRVFMSDSVGANVEAASGLAEYEVHLRSRALLHAACLAGVLFGGVLLIELL